MGLKYFDEVAGVERFKRRYVWAFWSYVAGMISAAVLLLAIL